MLQFIIGTAGSGKTWHVRKLIADKVVQGERGILLLVPEQNNYESERAMLHLLGSASADIVEVSSFSLLARNISALCGTDALRVADDGVKLLMMSRAVREVQEHLRFFKKSVAKRELCTKLLEFYTEIKRSAVTGDDLSATSLKLSGSIGDKLADISLIYNTYESLLSGRFSDPLDDLVRLGENLNTVDYFAGRTVVIDAFKGFTEQQFRIISHILRQAAEVYITVCADCLEDINEGTGIFSNNKATAAALLRLAHKEGVKVAAPINVNNNYRFNGTVIRSVEQVLRGKAACSTNGGELVICSCTSIHDEADYIARTIRKLVRTENYRFRDFAVVARDMSEYRNLLCDAFARYKVACFSDLRTQASSLTLFRYVLNAVHCSVYGFTSDLIMQLVKSSVSCFTVEEASMLENYVLMWNIKGSEWKNEWVKNPNGLEESFDKELLYLLNSLREKAILPLINLSDAMASGEARVICKGIYDMLIAAKADKSLAKFAAEFDSRSEFYFADLHRQSWDALMSCLDNAVRVFDGDSCDKHEFSDMFEVLLSSCDIGTIPDKLDEVVIGSADRIRAGNPRITFIIGANYSSFPKPIGKGGLLSLSERKSVIGAGVEITDFERYTAVDEQFYIYSALCTPSERLYITYHTVAKAGDKCLPAEFVNKLRTLIPESVSTVSSATETDRFEGVLPSIELISTEKYRKYADSVREQLAQRDIAAAAISLDGPNAEFAELSEEIAIKLFGKDVFMSASKVEVYSHCPFSYFCQYGLRAKPIRSAELDVMHRGTLVHYVMEKAISTHSRALSEMSADIRMDEIKQLIRDFSDTALGGYDSLDKSFIFMLDRIALMLDRLLARYGEELKYCEFSPDRMELEIGSDEIPPVSIKLDKGNMYLTGSVDRIDIYKADDKTYIRVVDYKTGSKSFDLSDIFYGMNMQMLIYLFTVASSGLYKNPVSAGVLYMPSVRPVHTVDRRVSDDELAVMDDDKLRMNGLLLDDMASLTAMERDLNGRFIPYKPKGTKSVADGKTFDNIEIKVSEMLKAIGNSIHSGRVSAHPTDSVGKGGDACKYCEYATVCLRDKSLEHDLVKKLKPSDAIAKLNGDDEDGI